MEECDCMWVLVDRDKEQDIYSYSRHAFQSWAVSLDCKSVTALVKWHVNKDKDKDKDKDLFIGPQEFVVGYSKAPEQPQSSARPICHSHTMTRTGREPATVRIAA